MIDMIIEKNRCTGCGLCSSICSKACIEMIPDFIEGFLYPVVDYMRCIKCQRCLKICPIFNEKKDTGNYHQPIVYAAWSLNENVRYNSTSGGLFSHLAISILRKKGCVVGAAYFDDSFKVRHIMIEDEKELRKIIQSKYTQSDITSVLDLIEKALKGGKIVLFSGTPCQCAAVSMLFSQNYDKIVLCDFICRGVNSPKVYKSYLIDLEKQFNSKIKRVWFKNKYNGWNKFHTRIEFNNGQIYSKDRYKDLFMVGYLKYNLYMRDSCNMCNFKGLPRVSDITLGDFWGIKLEDVDIEKGISVVMVNSKKGMELFLSISQDVASIKRTMEDVIENNLCLKQSVPKGKYKQYFYESLDKYGFEKSMNLVIERKKNEK